MSALRKAVGDLKQAMSDIESIITQPDPPDKALEGFKMTLDSVRMDALALVAAAYSGDYDEYIRKFRLRRAAQVCQNVLFGLVDGTVNERTPGVIELQSTIRETLDRLDQLEWL